MLFETMPQTLHSNKRKNPHGHDEIPLAKRITLEHQAAMDRDTSDQTSSFVLSNGVLVSQIRSPSGKRKSRLSTKTDLLEATYENGVTKGSNQCVNENVSSGLKQDNIMLDACLLEDSQDDIVQSKSPQKSSQISLNMKQPSLILTDLKRTSSPERTKVENSKQNVFESGGYMRRMASLNASACVAALMEPEKKSKSLKANTLTYINRLVRSPQRSSSTSSSDGLPSPMLSPHLRETLRPKDFLLSPTSLYNSSTSALSLSESEADTSKDSDDLEPHVYGALLALAMAGFEPDEVSYNKLGLLYNGDTLYPCARVFYASDTDLTLPGKIIPRIVPSREMFVRSAVDDALRRRPNKTKKKGAKVYMYMHDPPSWCNACMHIYCIFRPTMDG